jgi:DNA processing protein
MNGAVLPDAERLAWLRLARTENVGPVTFHQLLRHYGSATAALEALPGLARRGGRAPPLRLASVAQAERELAAHARLDARLIAWGEPDYPARLAALDDAPPLVTVKGDAARLAGPCVALVGARNASVNGRRFTESLARELGAAGFCVVSGLARGIDGAAHHGALETGTVAVVAGGADVIYPPEHARLQAEIGARGTVVAESPLGTEPHARHFPRRNRIISGLSLGVVVVEAAQKSGSLITARYAAEQGREVFAVPGSPLDPRCRGTNGLLRDGAHLVEGVEDVVGVLRSLPGLGAPANRAASGPPETVESAARSPAESAAGGLEAARAAVLEMLDPPPVAVDELVRRCHLSPAVLMTALLELELAGRVLRHPGNRVALAVGG